MSSLLRSHPISNLIQGVSQQAPQQRRDSQCEAQFDCFNSPRDGCVARNGFELLEALSTGTDFTGAWVKEIFRGEEHYLLVLLNGQLRAWSLPDGAPCTVTYTSPAAQAYIAHAAGVQDRDCFRAVTIDDFTFVANRRIAPAYTADRTPVRPKEALVFVRAGAYSIEYRLSLYFGGVQYSWTYATPDNSSDVNAIYVATSQIAATLYRAMTGNKARDDNSNAMDEDSYYNGDVNQSGGASLITAPKGTATAQGFSVSINGNILRIWRTDGKDFDITASDGAGSQNLKVFKGSITAVTDLPKGGFQGMLFGVSADPSNNNNDRPSQDYFVAYDSQSVSTGRWSETTAMGIPYRLDPATMPVGIVRTAVNTFEVRELVWSDRICGDGQTTAKDPGFIGRLIQDLFYHEGRLGFLTESSCDWSKALNEFTHFPDTIQTFLANQPIGARPGGSQAVPVFRKAVQVAGFLHLWANKAQYFVTQGNNQQFEADTIKLPPTTTYEFSRTADFAVQGTTMYFATEKGGNASVRLVPYNALNGTPQPDTDVTSHVSSYLPSTVRQLVVCDTMDCIILTGDSEPSNLSIYNYLSEGQQVVQAAWSKWRLPQGNIIWVGTDDTTMYCLLQRLGADTRLMLLACRLDSAAVDGDDKVANAYRTRLDLRVDETDCAVTYDYATRASTIVLPYKLAAGEQPRVVARQSASGGISRGHVFPVVSGSSDTFSVRGDVRATGFYAGLPIDSRRQESPFYLRTKDGLIPVDSIKVQDFSVDFSDSAYTRIEATGAGAYTSKKELPLVDLLAATPQLDRPPTVRDGRLSIRDLNQEAAQLTLAIVNDSPFPSRWQEAEYQIRTIQKAKGQ